MTRVPPPSARSATTVPPCDSATCWTIARPRPEPGIVRAERRAVEAVEDVRHVVLVDPGAVVADDDRAVCDRRPRPRRRAGSTWPRCRAGCRSPAPARPGRRGRPTRSRSVLNVTLGRCRRVRSTASAATRSRRTSSGSAGSASPRASSISSAISAVISPICSTTSSSSCRARPRRARGRSSGTSKFVRRLVSGVRSSCEASATSCRCASLDSLERAEHRVEAAREPAELVLAVRLDPLGKVARLRDPLGRLRQPRTGASAARETISPSATASAIPTRPARIRNVREPGERVGRPRSAAAHLQRAARPSGEGQHADVRVLPTRRRP